MKLKKLKVIFMLHKFSKFGLYHGALSIRVQEVIIKTWFVPLITFGLGISRNQDVPQKAKEILLITWRKVVKRLFGLPPWVPSIILNGMLKGFDILELWNYQNNKKVLNFNKLNNIEPNYS